MKINVVPEKPKKRGIPKPEKPKKRKAKDELPEEQGVTATEEASMEEATPAESEAPVADTEAVPEEVGPEKKQKAGKLGLASRKQKETAKPGLATKKQKETVVAEIVEEDGLADFDIQDDGSLTLSFILLLVCSVAIMFVVGFTGGSMLLRTLGVIP